MRSSRCKVWPCGRGEGQIPNQKALQDFWRVRVRLSWLESAGRNPCDRMGNSKICLMRSKSYKACAAKVIAGITASLNLSSLPAKDSIYAGVAVFKAAPSKKRRIKAHTCSSSVWIRSSLIMTKVKDFDRVYVYPVEELPSQTF